VNTHNTTTNWELQITETELSRMTHDLDQAHRETIPTMYATAHDFADELADTTSTSTPLARRRFLLGIGGVGAGLALAACGTSTPSPSGSPTSSAATPASTYTGDLKVVALATALENQAIAAYTTALTAAKAGKLGSVPPAVGQFAMTAMSQHADHADHAKAWNAVLTSAHKPPITGIPLSGQPAVQKALNSVTTVGDVATLALQLENQAAQTYLFAEANVTSTGGISTAATIAPVEAMHAAILTFVLGQYPVPDNFIATNLAANPSTLTV
jgi:hypothetical protein